MAVLLKDGNAEAVKGVDIAGVVIAGEIMDPLPHFVGGFICKGYAQNVFGKDPDLIDKKGKTAGQCSCFAGAGSGNNANHAFRAGNSLAL